MLTTQSTGGITAKELLSVKADSVASDQRAIMWLLITAEFLMLFALLAKLIVRFNVDKNQAEFVDVKEAMSRALQVASLDYVRSKVEEMLKRGEISREKFEKLMEFLR